jgi:hypothetical protein
MSRLPPLWGFPVHNGVEPGRVEPYRSEIVGDLRELVQEPLNPSDGYFQLIPEQRVLVERWLCGEVWYHLNVGVWPGLAGVDQAKFCIDLQCLPLAGRLASRENAVLLIRDLYVGRDRDCPDWLDRPVLVAGVDLSTS